LSLEIWRATPGAEQQVKAAEILFDDPVDLDAARRFLADDANVLLVAYDDSEPAGFVTGTTLSHPDKPAPEMFLNELAVHEPFRGRGIGRLLVKDLWRLAEKRGCRGMWVLADDDNIAANRVYLGAGGARGAAERMYQWGET
jgi:ribosomal protein S18 acetylase RimI-like enzyme